MRIRGPALLLLTLCWAGVAAQSSPERPGSNLQEPPWVLLIDPVCPVTAFSSVPNATKEIRVMYFPTAASAKIKTPQSLSLQVAFNGPHYLNNRAIVPFVHKDNYWEAVVPLDKTRASYSILYVKDEITTSIDDNAGKYWDVVFCDPSGQKSGWGIGLQAQSYKGESWPLNIRRAKNLGRAVSLLENAIASELSRASSLSEKLWEYKAERDGGDAEAYAKIAGEIERYLGDHPKDTWAAGNFVVGHADKLAADFVERTLTTVDAKRNDPGFSYRAEAAHRRAMGEPDPKKRLAALEDIIVHYPGTVQAGSAEASRFYALIGLGDVSGAEVAFARYRDTISRNKDFSNPNLYNDYLAMARLYINKGVKLNSALNLIDDALQTLQAEAGPPGIELPPEFHRHAKGHCAGLRARAYLGLHKPELAVTPAQQAVAVLKDNAEAHFVLAQAYASVLDKQKALDEYFEAALMPSNKDLEYRAELERYYRKNFGTLKQYEAALGRRIADRFQAAHYVPKLLDQPAPTLEFKTLKGENLDAAALREKVVVINFWSPG